MDFVIGDLDIGFGFFNIVILLFIFNVIEVDGYEELDCEEFIFVWNICCLGLIIGNKIFLDCK